MSTNPEFSKGRSNVEFSKAERAPILIQSALLMFVLLFWKYYQQELILSDVLAHALFFFGCSLIIIIFHEAGHKFMAEKFGYTATVTQFNGGILASTVAIFFTFARFPLIIGNPVALDADARKRLGKHRQYENPKQYAFISFAGILSSVLVIAAFRLLANITANEIFAMVALVAGIHAISSLIPWELLSVLILRVKRTIPDMTPGDGLLIIRWHIIAWIFAFIFTVVYVVLMTTGSTLAFILAIVFAAVAAGAHLLMQGQDR